MFKKNLYLSLFILVIGLLAGFAVLNFKTPAQGTGSHGHEEAGHTEEGHEEAEKPVKGPHGGRLLSDKDLQLEVKIYESGVPPEFRVYLLRQGKSLPFQGFSLKAQVKRLGKSDAISFKPERDYLRGQQEIYEPHSFEAVFEGQFQGKTYRWAYSQTEGRLQVPDEMRRRSEIQILKAGPQVLSKKLVFPGQIALDQDKYVHIVPPLAGRAVEVLKHVGEKVAKGEVLAVIHSRELSDLRLQRVLLQQKSSRERFLWQREESQRQALLSLLKLLRQGQDPEAIHNQLLKAPLGEAKSLILTAFADLRLARQKMQRERELSQAKLASQEDTQTARTEYENALSHYRGVVEEAVLQRESAGVLQRQSLQAVESEQAALEQKLKILQVGPGKEGSARYELRSPISGVVTQKHLSMGESVGVDSEVFVIADLSIVWAEMLVPDTQLEQVGLGQRVRVISQNRKREAFGVISHNSPVVDPETRRAEAHAHIANSDGFWRPGMFVSVEVLTDARRVPVAVARSAIQSFRDWQVVFAQFGETFEVRPLELGEEDETWVEVKSGLSPGQPYAALNSFVLKAELGKSAASHDH